MINTVVSDILSSIRFLSRLPVPNPDGDEKPDFKHSAYTFPIAGLIIAIPAALVLWVALILGLNPYVSSFLSFAVLTLSTGALHEDGLADTFDGFFGGYNLARKLEIMRDSTIGTYGTLALIFSVGLRVSLLAVIVMESDQGWAAAIALVCAASLSRAVLLYPWSTLPPARKSIDKHASSDGKTISGLSVRYGTPNQNTCLKAALFAVPSLGLLLIAIGWWATLLGVVILVLSTLFVTHISKQQIDGHTGDTLGATQQISEIGLLLGLAIAM